jgi:hypothetical protein
MERLSTAWTRLAAVAILAAAVWLCFRPLTSAEATLWDDLVRPPLRTAFFAPDAWSSFIYGLLAKRTAGLLRLSEFTLRLPALLAGTAWLLLTPKKPLYAIVPLLLGWFTTAEGYGISLALCAAAWRWRSAAPWLLGLAIAVSPLFAIPLGLYALTRGIASIERVAIPALVTAFVILIVPLSHAATPANGAIGSRKERAVRDALQPLRGRAAELAVTPDTLPLLEFYKARYRQRNWQIESNLMDRGQSGGFQPLPGAATIRYRFTN